MNVHDIIPIIEKRKPPFLPLFADILCGNSVMLIGSGVSRAPSSWLSSDAIRSVRFNYKMLSDPYYAPIPVLCNICWSRVCFKSMEAQNLMHPDMKIFCFATGCMTKKRKVCGMTVIHDRFRDCENDVGSWFSFVTKQLSIANGQRKLYTTGFYMTLWLLWGDFKSIYVVGFDGHDGSMYKRHGNSKYSPVLAKNDTHDYNGEWAFIDLASQYARKRGVDVRISMDM